MTIGERHEMQTNVKDILVDMTIQCTLPTDMTQLDIAEIFKVAHVTMVAENFLCAIDTPTAVQVSRIVDEYNRGNLHGVIDHVDDVDVVERYEYVFTIEAFLEEIGYL